MKTIFIGGTGRSGTSILSKILAQDSEVLNFGESRFLVDFPTTKDYLDNEEIVSKKYMDYMQKGVRHGLMKINPWINNIEFTKNALAAYAIKRIYKLNNPNFKELVNNFYKMGLNAANRSIMLEKTPHNIIITDILNRVFDDLKFIHVLRDPRDIFCSIKQVKWGPNNSDEFIVWYNELMNKAYEMKDNIKDYLVVSLEDVVCSNIVIKEVFNFVGIKFKEEYTSLINRNNSHIKRYLDDISGDESRKIWANCRDIYMKWDILKL